MRRRVDEIPDVEVVVKHDRGCEASWEDGSEVELFEGWDRIIFADYYCSAHHVCGGMVRVKVGQLPETKDLPDAYEDE
jgi:hypothetical protein